MKENMDFEFTSAENSTPASIEYKEGEEAKLDEGVTSADFQFVQQDKSIHDVKFTTKPTTFFRDAMRRFTKNKSSVVGGIILGVLFLFAIILPLPGIVQFDVESTHPEESNLPPKVFPTGTGFWDGTYRFDNVSYPYDSDGNWIGSYSEDSLLHIENVREGYGDLLSGANGSGGFLTTTRDALPDDASEDELYISGYLYSYRYTYSLDTTYTMTYTLGWRDEADYTQSKFDILFYDGKTFYPLTDYSLSYGDFVPSESNEMTVTAYEPQTVNLTDLVKNCESLMEAYPDATSISGSFGFCYQGSRLKDTALYVKDVTFTSDSTSSREAGQMAARSFTDATECLNRAQKTGNQFNAGYWASNSSVQRFAADSHTTRCDLVYDMYTAVYGYRTDLTALPQSVFDKWIEQGYITYTFGDPSSFKITEAGEASGEVYVRSVISDTQDGDTRNLQCDMLAWKYFGYSSMPAHVFGTDNDGRDILKYSFEGLRNSFLIGIAVAVINIIIGVIWGSITGYFGGKVDLIMERFIDILAGIPWIVLMTVLCIKIGQTPGVFILALCLTGWIGTESVTRSQFYRYRGREYVLASKTLGAKSPRLIFRHILPNAIGTIVTSSVLLIPSVIFNEATISYLGLGFRNMASLGVILSRYQATLTQYPFQLAVPAVIIALLMICFNLFGNGLRDAFNPSLKGTD